MTILDLGTSPLADLVGFEFRAPDRDVVADVRTVQARADALLDALPDADWDLPLSASAVPGAPPWTLRDHVGHVADWNDEAYGYIRPLLEGTGGAPSDADYGSDFDAWNEERRPRYASRTPAGLRAWHRESADRLFELAQRLSPETAASDDAWEWIWHNLTSHVVEHLAPVPVAGSGPADG
jgi:hypothetical protein